MADYLNTTEARLTLETLEKEGQLPSNTYLGNTAQDTSLWLDRFEVVEISEPRCWRLVYQADGEESEEAVFSLHGVIIGKELPPILNLPKMSSRSHHFLRQTVTLSGLGNLNFETAVDRSLEVYNKYRRFFPENQLLPWTTLNCTLTNSRSLTFSNRYFTRRAEAPTLRTLPFEVEVDPKRLLTQMISGHIFHSADNKVGYYTRYADEEGKLVHDATNPQTFRVGDIVEVQFSFVAYHMRTGQYILKPMLFSIALVDGKYSDEMGKRAIRAAPITTLSVKRRTGYDIAPRPSKIPRRRQGDWSELPTEEMGGMSIEP